MFRRVNTLNTDDDWLCNLSTQSMEAVSDHFWKFPKPTIQHSHPLHAVLGFDPFKLTFFMLHPTISLVVLMWNSRVQRYECPPGETFWKSVIHTFKQYQVSSLSMTDSFLLHLAVWPCRTANFWLSDNMSYNSFFSSSTRPFFVTGMSHLTVALSVWGLSWGAASSQDCLSHPVPLQLNLGQHQTARATVGIILSRAY